MKKIILIPSIIFLLLFTPCAARGDWLDKELEHLQKKYSVPALAAAVVTSDGILEIAAHGVRKMGAPPTVTVNDAFHIGSVTKSMTALLAAKIVKEGKIGFDTKVTDLYPQLKTTINRRFKDVTLDDLLMHRAGIPPFTLRQHWEKVPKFDGTLKEQRKRFVFWLLSRSEGGRRGVFRYSNTGYDIAASLLEAVTGKPWESLIKEYVFTPLELRTAGFGNPAKDDRSKVWGHWQRWIGRTPTEPVDPDQHGLNPLDAPSGDVHMSIKDLAKYAQYHLAGLRGKAGGNSALIRMLHTSNEDYSYGWFIRNNSGRKYSEHWGSPATFITGVVVCHGANLAIVVTANSSDNDSKKACRLLIEKALDKHFDYSASGGQGAFL